LSEEEKFIEYLWKSNQKALGLTDEQVEEAKKDPRRVAFIKRSPDLVRRKIVAEVIKAEHCVCHKVGDRIVFRPVGALVEKESCEHPCIYAIAPLATLCYIVFDRILEGVDPNQIRIPRIKCWDIGWENGGAGEILMEVHVE